MKKCTGCLELKEICKFSRCSKNKDGLQTKCKLCHIAYYNKNKELLIVQIRSYRLANLEKEKESSRQRYWKNRNQRLQNNKRNHALNKELWNKNNQDKRNVNAEPLN